MASEAKRFDFDTVFDGQGGVAHTAPRPKRVFLAAEVDEIRKAAHAEGERAALASITSRQQQALALIAASCAQALPRLAEVAHDHRVASADLAMACARGIAGAALDRFPEAPVQAALEALAREIEAAPRLVVTADPELAGKLDKLLEEAAARVGFSGAIQVKSDEAMGRHAFILDFGDGAGAFDPKAAEARVSEALEAALAAEGLHAEPLIPGLPSPDAES